MAAYRLKSYGSCALIAGGALAVYFNSLSCPFAFDDLNAVIENPHVRSLWPLGQALSAPSQSSVAGRPVVCLTLAINYALGGLDVRGYHVANLIVHIFGGLLLFGIVHRTLSMDRLAARYGQHATGLALAAALIWVVHPLQTEAVTYIVQRAESLMALFYLATLYGFIRSCQSSRPGLWRFAIVVCSGLAMASKEVAVTLPILVLLYDRVFVATSFRQALAARLYFYAGLASTWLILAGLIADGPRSESAGFGIRAITPLDYALTQPGVILHYLSLSFWPRSLCIDYGWRPARSASEIVPPLIVVLLLLCATAWAINRRPPLGFLPICFFLILAPTSSIVPIQDLAVEHRMYLPLTALCVLVVIIVHDCLLALHATAPRVSRHRLLIGGVLITTAVVLLGTRTVMRNRDYASAESIWRDAVANRPTNARACYNLGAALAQQGDFTGAIIFHRKALLISSTFVEALYGLALALVKTHRCAEAIPPAREAVRLSPGDSKAHVLLGIALSSEGYLQGAITQFQKALALDPSYAEAHFHLARIYEAKGLLDEAEDRYRQALRVQGTYPEACRQLAALLARRGRPAEVMSLCPPVPELSRPKTDPPATETLGTRSLQAP